MQISNGLYLRNTYQTNPTNPTKQGAPIQLERFSSAVTKGELADKEGEFLGLTMILGGGMTALLSKNSTPDKPIVHVVIDMGESLEAYDVDISKVNPANASRLEIFALCGYADKIGCGTGDTFGSYNTFKMYELTAEVNGCMGQVDVSIPTLEQFKNEKVDWLTITKSVLDILARHKDPKVLELFTKGKKLMNLYHIWANRSGQ